MDTFSFCKLKKNCFENKTDLLQHMKPRNLAYMSGPSNIVVDNRRALESYFFLESLHYNEDLTSYINTPWLVLHAEGVHVNDALLLATQDVVQLEVETFSFLLEHCPLCLYILQFVAHRLQTVFKLFSLKKKQYQWIFSQSAIFDLRSW